MFSESQPFRALGNVVLIGVLLAFVFSVLLLPALVMLLPHRIEPGRQRDYAPWMSALAAHLNRHLPRARNGWDSEKLRMANPIAVVRLVSQIGCRLIRRLSIRAGVLAIPSRRS